MLAYVLKDLEQPPPLPDRDLDDLVLRGGGDQALADRRDPRAPADADTGQSVVEAVVVGLDRCLAGRRQRRLRPLPQEGWQ